MGGGRGEGGLGFGTFREGAEEELVMGGWSWVLAGAEGGREKGGKVQGIRYVGSARWCIGEVGRGCRGGRRRGLQEAG